MKAGPLRTGPRGSRVWTRPAILLAAVLLAPGCAGPGGIPEDSFYRLVEPEPAVRLPQVLLPGLLLVEPLDSDGLRAERALLYSSDPGNRRFRQYHYHLWLEAPPRLVQRYLAEYLDRAGLADAIATESYGLRPAFLLRGRLERFEQLLDDDRPRVRVALRLVLEDRAGDRILHQGAYAAEVPGESAPGGAVEAFEKALDQILAAFVGELLSTSDQM